MKAPPVYVGTYNLKIEYSIKPDETSLSSHATDAVVWCRNPMIRFGINVLTIKGVDINMKLHRKDIIYFHTSLVI